VETTPETAALLADLFERSQIVAELDGPQIEAWVSGLFALFDHEVTPGVFIDHCAAEGTPIAGLLCLAMAELLAGDDDSLAATAGQVVVDLDHELFPAARQVGASQLEQAWVVEAPFGRSIVLGFDNPIRMQSLEGYDIDAGHSVLVEVTEEGELEDLQLTGPPRTLLDEAVLVDDRVRVHEVTIEEAVQMVVSAWPEANVGHAMNGPGVGANQQFVRQRIRRAADYMLPSIASQVEQIDIRRGLDDAGFADANRVALSTLRAAVGDKPSEQIEDAAPELVELWSALIRGDGGDFSAREREALLWLEWADWLGAGIGMLRAGRGAEASGAALVDYVNRCPEVSSSIQKSDRGYAEWAFSLALELLEDRGALDEGVLNNEGYQALGPAMLTAWAP